MGCNCKGKTINNLGIPSYIRMAKEVWDKVSSLQFEDITDELWMELYMTYNQLYPNSKGQPDKQELLTIINKATQYKS